jgi:hypothetical protein
LNRPNASPHVSNGIVFGMMVWVRESIIFYLENTSVSIYKESNKIDDRWLEGAASAADLFLLSEAIREISRTFG